VKEIDTLKNLSTIKKLIFKGANPNAKDLMQRKPVDLLADIKDESIKLKLQKTLSKSSNSNICGSLY
jgi:hypothetical protein